MKITEIAFTAYPVKDMSRARSFYEGILGLVPSTDSTSEDGHWVEYEIAGGTLALGCAPDWEPSVQGCSVGLEVEDFQQMLTTIQEAKIPTTMGPLETPVCHMVIVSDPEGNSVILHKRKPGHP